ncbi:MAG: Guanylate kinase [Candidatus Saccharibacteria bacterium]|nr:Guanylate kinase [Candidatus Saccharibacteria bacterium]
MRYTGDMALSPELQERLGKLIEQRDNYAYASDQLQEKAFVAILGPTAVGKSTLTNACLQECRNRGISAGIGDTITTRDRRIGEDPPTYITANEGVTFESMIDQIERGELVNWSMHGTGHLYGSTPEAMVHDYTIAPIMPDSLPMMRSAGFAEVLAIYLAIPVEQWKQQLELRQDDPKFVGRMSEAISELEYAKKHKNELALLAIEHGEAPIHQKATEIIDKLVNGEVLTSDLNALDLIDEMLTFARTMVNGNS